MQPEKTSQIIRKALIPSFIISLLTLLSFSPLNADNQEEEYDAEYHTMHHILDGYSWDFFKFPGDDEYVNLELPRILWNGEQGTLDFYLNTDRAIESGDYISIYRLNNYYLDGELQIIQGDLLIPQASSEVERITNQLDEATDEDEIAQLQGELKEVINAYQPLDFSITVNVLYMFFASIILLLVFITVANRYKQNPYSPPKGVQSLLEPVILFVRDDIVRKNMPENKYKTYLPLLLTFFFFIWVLNLLGLTPFAANATGNIAVTATLASITLIVIIASGTRDYWKHMFWMPGVPVPMKFIMMIVEVISLFAKPFALCLRLFAVITAGHIIIVSLMALIFVFGNMGENPLGGFLISPLSVGFMLFITFLELLIVSLQAYVFTLLSTVFIAQALEDHEEHEEEASPAPAQAATT